MDDPITFELTMKSPGVMYTKVVDGWEEAQAFILRYAGSEEDLDRRKELERRMNMDNMRTALGE